MLFEVSGNRVGRAGMAVEFLIDRAMPKDFPGDLMESIAQGAASRLERIGLMLKADASA